MKYGRIDVSGPDECPEEGRLPGERFLAVIYFSLLRLFFLMIRETRSRYLLGAHRVKTPLLCNTHKPHRRGVHYVSPV